MCVCVYVGIWVSCFCVHNSELISQTARHSTHIGWNNPEAIAETICKEERWRKGIRMHIYAYRMSRCMCITAFLVFLVITMYVAVCVLIPQSANAPLRWKRPNLMKDQLWGMWMVRMESHCPSQRALHSRCQHRKVHLNSKCVHLCYHVAWMVLCVPVGWFTNSPALSLRLTDILGYSELCSPTVPRQSHVRTYLCYIQPKDQSLLCERMQEQKEVLRFQAEAPPVQFGVLQKAELLF